MSAIHRYLVFIILIHWFNYLFAYTIPEVKLEVLEGRGFRISIPHEDGIQSFRFHGSINRKLKGLQPGDFSGELSAPVNGYWVYENKNKALMPDDVLYFWISVQHENKSYKKLDQSILIPSPGTEPVTESENCVKSKTIVKNKSVCRGQLIFEDNFDTFNWTKWQREFQIPLETNDADFVSFHNYSRHLYVANGNLHIVPSLLTDVGYSPESIRSGSLNYGVRCTGVTDISRECQRNADKAYRILPPVASARIRSKKFFAFQYGKVEIRAKLPIGDWLFPQIFLEPLNNNYGANGYASGQMRVAFIHGNQILEDRNGHDISGKQLIGGCVLASGEEYRDLGLRRTLSGEHLGKNFHTYSLTWTDQSIVLALDNVNYAEIRGGFKDFYKVKNIKHAMTWENSEYMAPFDKEFYLALGVSAAGISDFPDECRNGIEKSLKPWKNTSPKGELAFWKDRHKWYKTWDPEHSGLIIDYIKVYAV